MNTLSWKATGIPKKQIRYNPDYCGIYTITVIVDNRIISVYFGKSSNIPERWKDHRYNLIRNKHINKSLNNDYNRYGNKCIKFDIVNICDLKFLDSFEKEVIYHARKIVKDKKLSIKIHNLSY